MKRPPVIAVIGAGDAPAAVCRLARQAGGEIARHGAILICGGRGGVMEAAAAGARSRGGRTIGVLPGYDRRTANRHIELVIATGMGEARNAIVVASADAIVALAGEGGTLAEIGFAKKMRKPVVALNSWAEIAGLHRAGTASAAVALAIETAAKRRYTNHGRIDNVGNRAGRIR
ncbi:MAG TPA: TIGR00725 family protein [Candidatus Binataceae bacterium]|nr:TIGR00725 family protein [Candidatus Binataceae bacterium]